MNISEKMQEQNFNVRKKQVDNYCTENNSTNSVVTNGKQYLLL